MFNYNGQVVIGCAINSEMECGRKNNNNNNNDYRLYTGDKSNDKLRKALFLAIDRVCFVDRIISKTKPRQSLQTAIISPFIGCRGSKSGLPDNVNALPNRFLKLIK